MLYIMGDYVHTHRLTQLNTLSLHTHTDMHKPKQLNVCWSNTFCVNSSFLLLKTNCTSSSRARTMWPFTLSRCSWLWNWFLSLGWENIVYLHAAADDTSQPKLSWAFCSWAAYGAVFWHHNIKCEPVVVHIRLPHSAKFWGRGPPIWLGNWLQLASLRPALGQCRHLELVLLNLKSGFCPGELNLFLGVHNEL